MTDTPAWYVRKADGAEFGPAGLAELIEWARDGRIAPDDSVSSDRAVWRPAPELDALEMHWMIETEPGVFYGPAHAMAFVGMLEEGALNGNVVVRNARTGQDTRLILLAARLEVRAESETIRARAPAGVETEDDSAGSAPERTVSWKAVAQEKDRFEHEAGKWKQLYDEEHARVADYQKRLLDATRELERDRIAHHTALEQAAREIEALRRAETLRESAAGPEALNHAYAELSRGFESLARQQDQKNRDLAELRENILGIRKGYEDRIALMDEQIRKEQAASDAAHVRLAEAERAHAEMVVMLRDLNDRYIRLREHQAHPTGEPGPDAAARPKIRMTRP